MPRRTTRLACGLLASFLTLVVPVGAQTTGNRPPVPEGNVIGAPAPPPLVSAGPGFRSPFPCGLEGRLLDGIYEPAEGTLKAAMIFVDFSDATGEGTDPQELYDGFVGQAREALATLSEGAFDLQVTPLLKWVRMPRPFSAYGFGPGIAPTYENHHGYIAKAIARTDPEFDFSAYSTVYVVSPPEAQLRAAADVGASGEPFEADGVSIPSAATLGSAEVDDRSFTVFAHETGHLLGLPDLYAEDFSVPPYVGAWDIMSVTAQPSTPMLAWTRLLVGWLQKGDFRCVKRTTKATLGPLTEPGSPRALAVRLGPRRAFLIEARTDQVGRECDNPGGVLVYSAVVSASQGAGPIRVANADPDDTFCSFELARAQFVPGTGKSRFVDPKERIAVDVVRREGDAFAVKVTVLPSACAVPDVVGRSLAKAERRLRAANCRVGRITADKGSRVVGQGQAAGTILPAGGRVAVFVDRR